VILATVGTHAQPFERFFAIVEAAQGLGHEVVVQHGTNPLPRGVAHAVAFMPYEELLAYVNEAEAVITHGGVGSILTASRAGHRPLVVARLRRYGEHVDNHQAELTRRLEELGHIVTVESAGKVPGALARVTASHQRVEREPTVLHHAVRAALLA
jgi:UDP-N-acetylglucosamine transferase subunit ALG13